jgi:hypothetical protein
MSARRWLMDHGSAVEKLEGVREIETSLRQDFLALFLIPFKFHAGDSYHMYPQPAITLVPTWSRARQR